MNEGKKYFPMLNQFGLAITSYELSGNQWEVVLTHIFWGKTIDETFKYAHSHLISDGFFSSSFSNQGFSWRGEILLMSNNYQILSEKSYQDPTKLIEDLLISGQKIHDQQKDRGFFTIINELSTINS